MKRSLLPFFSLLVHSLFSQDNTLVLKNNGFDKEKYLAVNFLSLTEPQLTFGPAFGYRFTERSEVFAEAAWVTRSPVYNWQEVEKMNGARFIMQYRYHWQGRARPLINFHLARRRFTSEREPFLAVEFRYKPYSFSSAATFVKSSTNDTLGNHPYRANATVIGGGLLLGHTTNLSGNENLQLEFTAGMGGKYRFIRFRDLPEGYAPLILRKVDFSYPQLPEEAASVYFVFAIRLRYVFN